MNLRRYENNPIMVARPDVEWEAGGVFNASVVRDGETFHMVYRALRPGFVQIENHPLGWRRYDNFVSSIGYATSADGIQFTARDTPLISPEHEWERFGSEDPRITKIGDSFFIHYTALSAPAYLGTDNTGIGHVRIALAQTTDFKIVEKHGIVGPPPESDVDSKAGTFVSVSSQRLGMLLTVNSTSPESSVIYTEFDSVEASIDTDNTYWAKLLNSVEQFAVKAPAVKGAGFEVGAPPVKTRSGLLFIYSRISNNEKWSIGAALLDPNNPRVVTNELPDPILEPEAPYEKLGLIDEVVFPGGAVVVGDELFVYYGAADSSICLATCDLEELLDELAKHPV